MCKKEKALPFTSSLASAEFNTSYGCDASFDASSGFGLNALNGTIVAMKYLYNFLLALFPHPPFGYLLLHLENEIGNDSKERGWGEVYPFLFAKSVIKSVSAFTLPMLKALYKDARKPPTVLCPLIPTIPFVLHSARNCFSSSSSFIIQTTFIKLLSSLATFGVKMGNASSDLYKSAVLASFNFSIAATPPC